MPLVLSLTHSEEKYVQWAIVEDDHSLFLYCLDLPNAFLGNKDSTSF